MTDRILVLCLVVLLVPLTAWQARGNVFDDVFGIDSISVPDEGTVFGALDDENRPDITEMSENRTRVLALMRNMDHGEIHDPVLTEYLEGVMAKIVSVSPYPDLQPRVHILSSVQNSAHCAPDGSLWISLGLLRDVKSEDELAFVLAHEFAHSVFEHWDSEWFERTQYYGVMAGRGARELGQNMSVTISKISGDSGQFPLAEDLDKWIRIGGLAYKFSNKILAPAWEREQEEVADALGLDIMTRAGYNVNAAISYLRQVEAIEGQREAELAAQRLSDQERTRHMDEAFRTRGLGGVLDEAFKELSDLFERGLDDLSASHYSASERIKVLQSYQFREYLTVGNPDLTQLPWTKSRSHVVRALVDRHDRANRAAMYLNEDDYENAAKHALQSISGVGSKLNFSRYVLYSVRAKQGRPDTALQNLQIAMSSGTPSVHILVAYVQHAVDAGDWESARERLDDADRQTGEAPGLLPLKILIYGNLGNKSVARQARLDCLDYKVQDFVEACNLSYAAVQSKLAN